MGNLTGGTSSLNEKFQIDGVQFIKPRNKTLRLYFQSRKIYIIIFILIYKTSNRVH
jgi:hypothetical protein